MCPANRYAGPVGYLLVEEVVKCPIIVFEKVNAMGCELLKLSDAIGVLRRHAVTLQPPKDMDKWSEEDELLYHAINVVLAAEARQRRDINSVKLILAMNYEA